MPIILVLNGPNLNMLGTREPAVYGEETLGDIEEICRTRASELGLAMEFRQSNMEGDLVTWIQDAGAYASGIVINAGALTHTSVAVLDALLAVDLPVVEVHLSNIYRREEFRHTSYISKAATGLVCGFGGFGYGLALDAVADLVEKSDSDEGVESV